MIHGTWLRIYEFSEKISAAVLNFITLAISASIKYFCRKGPQIKRKSGLLPGDFKNFFEKIKEKRVSQNLRNPNGCLAQLITNSKLITRIRNQNGLQTVIHGGQLQ